MNSRRKSKLTIGAVVAAAACLVGGGAYAATQTGSSKGSLSDPRQAFLNDVAGRLHVSVADLQAALKGAASDQVDAAVKAGRLTQAQADAIKRKIQQGAHVPFGGPFFGPAVPPPGRPFAGPLHGPLGVPFALGGGRGGVIQAGLDAASKYLGLTDAQVRKQLASGKSLADIAKAQGKSVAGLTATLKDAVKSKLDAAVAAKKITQAQETRMLDFADAAIAKIVSGKLPRGAPRPFLPGPLPAKPFKFRFHHGG